LSCSAARQSDPTSDAGGASSSPYGTATGCERRPWPERASRSHGRPPPLLLQLLTLRVSSPPSPESDRSASGCELQPPAAAAAATPAAAAASAPADSSRVRPEAAAGCGCRGPSGRAARPSAACSHKRKPAVEAAAGGGCSKPSQPAARLGAAGSGGSACSGALPRQRASTGSGAGADGCSRTGGRAGSPQPYLTHPAGPHRRPFVAPPPPGASQAEQTK